jgi:hypothetical protein
VSYINISETFYYLCGILEGCPLRRELGPAEVDERGHRGDLGAPRNFIRRRSPASSSTTGRSRANDFMEFVRISGMTHSPKDMLGDRQQEIHAERDR